MTSSVTQYPALVGIPVQPSTCQKLFSLSTQVHPYLKHCEFESDNSLALESNNSNSQSLLRLYENLKHRYPEAGKSYWSHKCWQLAIWQPVLLSMICVYALKISLPLSQLRINCHALSIYGYKLEIDRELQGDMLSIITHISRELRLLIESFYQQISQYFPLKYRFCQKLLSDQLLESLAKVAELAPQISRTDLAVHTQCWLLGLGLPSRILQIDSNKQVIRSSCCLEYRLDTRDYCKNCPKQRPTKNAKT